MPRIEAIRVLPFLWVAWQQDDYGHRSNLRRGLTDEHARRRVLRA